MKFLEILASVLVVGLMSAPPTSAAEIVPVDVELVLAADGSGSIDDEELKLQRQGYADAIMHPKVLAAIRGGYRQAIAVAYIEWGAPESQHVIVDWTLIKDEATARGFAERLVREPRAAFGYNSISNAIAFSADMIRNNNYNGSRKVIDVSGDGPQIGGRPLSEVRYETIRQGIVINALVIDSPGGGVRGPGGMPLSDHYRQDVIGGSGAFVAVAKDRAHIAEAMRKKLILEIADRSDSI